jgi:hypothetical protein
MASYQKFLVIVFITTAGFVRGFENKNLGLKGDLNPEKNLSKENVRQSVVAEPVYSVIEMTESEKRLAWLELAQILQPFLPIDA